MTAPKGVPADRSRVVELLGEPRFNSFFDPAWEGLESELGLALPDDYKWFVSAFGPCVLHGTFYVPHPQGVSLNLPDYIAYVSEEARDAREHLPEEFPNPVVPEAGGLVPVVETFQGDRVFLRPPADDDGWTVMVGWDTMRWDWHRMGFVAFLERVLGEPPEIPLISRDSFEWPEVPYRLSEYRNANSAS
ncbi:SMI1/KNR4 family protein [Streptomyces sp. NPDC058671]|uniref:SMI1/KNR4 family protein n=1 Tax=Streptomyces sp. NPDC058671 TaxID=3346590 RepID=UPI0036661F74